MILAVEGFAFPIRPTARLASATSSLSTNFHMLPGCFADS